MFLFGAPTEIGKLLPGTQADWIRELGPENSDPKGCSDMFRRFSGISDDLSLAIQGVEPKGRNSSPIAAKCSQAFTVAALIILIELFFYL